MRVRRRRRRGGGQEGQEESGYLVLRLGVGLALHAVGVVLQELGHIGHDGLLVWFVHVHV